MTDDQLDEDFEVEETVVRSDEAPQYGVGPFSIREVAIAGVWLVAFVVSFFSISVGRFESVWTSAILWILAIAVPTVAVFLIALRRLSPQGIRRVGSLGIDQFASVAFSVAAVVWLQLIWETVEFAIETGAWARSWVIWVEGVLMLAGVVLTVFAPLIPVLCEDFRGRPEVPAHRSARPIRPVSPRPARAPRTSEADASDISPYAPAPDVPSPYASSDAPAPAEPTADTSAFAPAHSRDTFERVAEPSSTVEPAAEPARHQAFWALVPEERDVVDEIGIPVFRIGPSAWALVIEDRGEAFVVRHEDGRIGYLHDVSDVTRG
ncbi:hypothetical protein [Microbacterium sp. Root180]|uniref:hypothetical protein n=1 Tax=Microbacterium sp. Root180 TaxID=1736483 RepID=UPI0006F89F5B|nr:hypothetical protein [Microbacterium sp. Root180]KRB37652.1 hypothetical protein ASD93_04730 [Microbacterium sp. Root180]